MTLLVLTKAKPFPHFLRAYLHFRSLDQRCVHNGSAMVLYIVSYVVFIVTYFAIACCERVRKRSPGNIIAISIFTLSLSLLVSTICLFHDVTWVLMAMGITAALCLGLTLFSFQTKIDFTGTRLYMHEITFWQNLFSNLPMTLHLNNRFFLYHSGIGPLSIYRVLVSLHFWNHGNNIFIHWKQRSLHR